MICDKHSNIDCFQTNALIKLSRLGLNHHDTHIADCPAYTFTKSNQFFILCENMDWNMTHLKYVISQAVSLHTHKVKADDTVRISVCKFSLSVHTAILNIWKIKNDSIHFAFNFATTVSTWDKDRNLDLYSELSIFLCSN